MDHKTMKTFHLIVHHQSFQRAADELNYSQSAVTMQIQKLEAQLGVRLIERGKVFRLTEAGRLFHARSAGLVRDLEQLQEEMSGYASGGTGHVRLGAVEPFASWRLPQLLQQFLSGHPQIRVSVDIASSALLSQRLSQGELDLALCSAPPLDSGLLFDGLYNEDFVMLLPEDHPLALQQEIGLEDFRGHRLLITAAGCLYRKKLEIALQETGQLPLDTMEIGSMTALQHYVAAGLGIALVPVIALNPIPPGTVTRPLVSSAIELTCGLLCRTADSPLSQAGAKLYRFLSCELSAKRDASCAVPGESG